MQAWSVSSMLSSTYRSSESFRPMPDIKTSLIFTALLATVATIALLSASCTKKSLDDASGLGELMQEPVDLPGLHNVVRATSDVWSGAEPKGDEAFETLRALGVRTIVSVDGAKPDVDTARQYGMRYIHLPFGYDGVPADITLGLKAVVDEADKPIYVHCHHGKHRGPTAVAIIMRLEGIDARTADRFMHLAGTGTNYTGLWRDVASFKQPAPDVELPTLVEVAPTGTLVVEMAKLSRVYERLQSLELNDWQPMADHPDLSAAQEALILYEMFYELHRNRDADVPADQHARFAASVKHADAMLNALRQADTSAASAHLRRLDADCKSCHKAYRD